MNIENLQKHISAERAVHITMIIFALASVTNIKSFFIAADHDELAAWAIGGALGLVLVSASIMLSKIDFDNERFTFWLVAAITGFIALLSGTIQMLAYAQHIESRFTAALLGYGLPVGGEMLLAIAVSMFDLAHKRQRIRNVSTKTEEQIAEAIGAALSDVDVSKVKKYAERKVDAIVRAQVDKVSAAYLPTREKGNSETAQPTPEVTNGNYQGNEKESFSNQITDFGATNLPEANQARYRKIEERRQLIVAFITENGPMTVAEITEKLDGAAKEKTVRTDCNELERDGRLFKKGKQWTVATLPQLGLPELEPSQPLYTNGSQV